MAGSKLLKVMIAARILESCQCWLTEKVVFWKLSLRCSLSSKFCKSLLVLEVSPENVCGKGLQLFYSRHRRVLERWKKQMVLECPPVVTTLSHFVPLKQRGAGWGPNCSKKWLQHFILYPFIYLCALSFSIFHVYLDFSFPSEISFWGFGVEKYCIQLQILL